MPMFTVSGSVDRFSFCVIVEAENPDEASDVVECMPADELVGLNSLDVEVEEIRPATPHEVLTQEYADFVHANFGSKDPAILARIREMGEQLSLLNPQNGR